jgi:hypothetical protein
MALAEMPKITNCLKCLKLMYSVDFIMFETQATR